MTPQLRAYGIWGLMVAGLAFGGQGFGFQGLATTQLQTGLTKHVTLDEGSSAMCEGEGLYTGYIGRMEKKTETTGVIGVIYGSYIGIMEQNMETSGGGFRVSQM